MLNYSQHTPVTLEPLTLNFTDKSHFDTDQFTDFSNSEKPSAIRYFLKEATHLQKMKEIVTEGRQIMYTLYGFRSLGKAIPQATADIHDKDSLYRGTYQVLRPQVLNMMHLMKFKDKLISCLSDSLTALIPDIKDKDVFASETYLLTLADMLDVVVSVDTMKSMKGSMNNDLSMYKRVLSFLPKDENTLGDMAVIPKLALFIATKESFTQEVKKMLSTINSAYEDIFMDMVNLIQDHLENKHYLTPMVKHTFFRALAISMVLLDDEGDEKDLSRRRKLRLDKLGKLFKTTPIIPLFGDIAIQLSSIYAKIPHLHLLKWETPDPEFVKSQYSLENIYPPTLYTYSNLQIKLKRAADETNLSEKILYPTVLETLKFITAITSSVLEYAACKFIYPNTSHADATGYEMSVRYNYSNNEKKILIYFISMIKNLSGMLLKFNGRFLATLESFIYHKTHDFLGTISDYYNQAQKRKRATAPILKYTMDALNTKSTPSATQLYFSRSVLDYICNEKSKGMKGGLMKEKNFTTKEAQELTTFIEDSFYFTWMMNLRITTQTSSDLSNLWFKEFYLELSKCIQFPISTSLPWILTEYALESNRADMFQLAFYPLELYNDAAACTLHQCKSRIIYDEIEAEVNLCFDQFMFKFGQRVFTHFKELASLQLMYSDGMLDTKYRHHVDTSIFETISHTTLLGRFVDCNLILGQMMNQYLRYSVDIAIGRFEASDLSFIIELDKLLEIARNTHVHLSSYFKLENFDDIFNEINGSSCFGPKNGRIQAHILQELIQDVIPNFTYSSDTQRFVRGSVFYTDPIQREALPKARFMYTFGNKHFSIAYAIHMSLLKDFLGFVHFNVLVKYLNLANLFKELVRNASLIIERTLVPFMDVLLEEIPKQPVVQYENGITVNYQSLLTQYRDIFSKNLKSEILQSFRELGNTLLVVKILEESIGLNHSLVKPFVDDLFASDKTTVLMTMRSKYPQVNYCMSFQEWDTKLSELLTKAPPNIMSSFLAYMTNSLQMIENQEPEYDNPRAFFKVWNALLFAVCVLSQEKSLRDIYGDGLVWAGTTILFCLNQTGLFNIVDLTRVLLNFNEIPPEMTGVLEMAHTVKELSQEVLDYLEAWKQ